MQPAHSLVWLRRDDVSSSPAKKRVSQTNESLSATSKPSDQPCISVGGSSSTNRESSAGYAGDDERPSEEQLIPQDNALELKTYPVRYYILLIFSVTAFMQYCAWNAFGPISTTCKAVFGWGNSEIAIMASLDPITYLLTMLFFSWMMDVKGLRKSLLISTFFMAFGTGLRCITADRGYVTWTMAAGQFFNGLAGPVTQAAPPLLSSNWFPPEQRTTATALASLCGSFGVALSFIIGPFAVEEIDFSLYEHVDEHVNRTKFIDHHLHYLDFSVTPEYFRDSIYKNASHYWPFEDPAQSLNPNNATRRSNSVSFMDIKGSASGILFGDAHFTKGVVNQSVTVSSSQGFVNLGNYPYGCLEDVSTCHDGLSIAFWLRYSNTTESFQHFLGTGDEDPGNVGFLVYHHSKLSKGPVVHVQFSTGHMFYNASVTIPYDQWHHLAITWNVTEGVQVFVDGTLAVAGSKPFPTIPLAVDSSTLSIGNKWRNKQSAVHWNVSIDELVVWHSLLHPAEIRVIYLRSVGLKEEPEKIRKENELMDVIEERRDDIMHLMYIEFAVIVSLFLLVLLYFPDKPPTPPSRSAHIKRANFKAGAKALVRSGSFWTLALVYGLTTGVYSGWGAVLNVNLSSFGVSQEESGWIGFYAVIAGVFAGLLLAR